MDNLTSGLDLGRIINSVFTRCAIFVFSLGLLAAVDIQANRIMLDADVPASDNRHLCMLPCFYHNATPVAGLPFNPASKSVVHLKGTMKNMLNELKRCVVNFF